MADLKQARAEAAALAGDVAPEWGWFRWLERRIIERDQPEVSQWWRDTVRAFYASGADELAALVGMRGTKSHTACRLAVAEALFRERTPVLGTDLVWGVYSCDLPEANGRATTIAALLGVVGMTEVDKRDKVSPGTFFRSGALGGRTTIATYDLSGNAIEFRIAPATTGGASGYTGIGLTCDELDLWRDGDGANPASQVLSVLRPRLFGQKGARVYRISAPFAETSPHTRAVRRGDTEGQCVARLGTWGAERDEAARAILAEMFRDRSRRGSQRDRRRFAAYAEDARLFERASADDYRIPTWVARDGDLSDLMLDCWKRAADDAAEDGSDPLAMLFARFGARPYGATGMRLIDPILLDRASRVHAI